MKHKVLIAVFFLLSGCSSVQSKDSTFTSSMPDWFQEAMKSEATIESSNRLNVSDLNLDDEVLGNFELANQDEGYWYFISEIDGSAAVECYVYTDFDGTANTLYRVIDYELEYISESYEQDITNRSNFGLDIGVIESAPYIALDTMYNVGTHNETRTGLVKAIAARTNQSLQVCVHNEIGYKETFYSLAESFISAIAKSEKSDSFYEPVYKLSINGMPIGFARESYSIDADGDILTRREQSLAIPVDESSISRNDTSTTEWSFPNGLLINSNTFSLENNDLQSSLSLLATENEWIVEGQLQGKEVKETLAHDDWILSSYGSYLAAQSLLESEGSLEEHNMWISQADPGAVTQVTLSKITEIPTANIKLEMGPVTTEYFFDENGIVQQGSSSQGNVSIDLEIMYVHGSPLQQ